MQSSTAIAIRALVMLIVLISVPLFAIFGKHVPEVIKGLLDGRGLVLTPAAGGDANQNTVAPLAGGSSPNQPAPYRVPAETSTAGRGDGRSEISRGDLLHSAPTPGSWPRINEPSDTSTAGSASGRGAAPTSFGAGTTTSATGAGQWHDPPPPNFSAPNGAAPNSIGGPGLGTSSGASGMQPSGLGMQSPGSMMPSPGTGVQPTIYQAPIGGPGSGTAQPQTTMRNDLVQTAPYGSTPPANRAGQPAAAQAGASDERFRQAEVQLRQLGATYYMLETWGPDNNRYRFSCKMPIGGNAGVNRLFQAIDEDPLLAMNSVLRQISQWRMQGGQAQNGPPQSGQMVQ